MDPNAYYTSNYAPFNILHELDNNYIELNVVDVKFQGEIKWKALPELEFSALGSLKYQASSQEHNILDNSNQATAYRTGMVTAPFVTTMGCFTAIRMIFTHYLSAFCHEEASINVKITKC